MSSTGLTRKRGPSRLLRALVWLPVAVGLLGAVLWLALRVGALDLFPWPQQLVFEGDAERFTACFEARAEIARKDDGTLVSRFSERPAESAPILMKMGGFIGQGGTRSVEILPDAAGFVLRDRHYLPEHSPLSQPLSKTDWIVAWQCAQRAG